MPDAARRIVRTYLVISGLFYLAASIIWGVNTLFLLDAGLTLFEAFVANAAWTAGMVVFEIPTGLVADTRGRRTSFLLSASILALGTIGYVVISWVGGGIVPFVLVSIVLGLAYTFYSGAVEAWLVDALRENGYTGELDPVFAKGGVVASAAMLVGTVSGGALGMLDLGFPYLARAALLLLAFGVAFAWMRDEGFTPRALRLRDVRREVGDVARASVRHGWGRPAVRLLMLVSFIQFGVGAWAFYAWQPYFLDLLGRGDLIWVAGVVAALIALAQIGGNALVRIVAKPGRRRSTILLVGAAAYAVSLAVVGMVSSFYLAVAIFVGGILVSAMATPIKQAYLHEMIPSAQRATVISFDGLFGSLGSVGGQVGLGWLSQTRSIPAGFVVSGVSALFALPLLALLRGRRERPDVIRSPAPDEEAAAEVAGAGGEAATDAAPR
ncbi:MAG TPA: MFS transporter [Actinomycetota bacterium]